MVSGTFHHFGVPTTRRSENETYIEGGKVFVTDPDAHPYRVEFLRFEADSPMPGDVKTKSHAAFIVKDRLQLLGQFVEACHRGFFPLVRVGRAGMRSSRRVDGWRPRCS